MRGGGVADKLVDGWLMAVKCAALDLRPRAHGRVAVTSRLQPVQHTAPVFSPLGAQFLRRSRSGGDSPQLHGGGSLLGCGSPELAVPHWGQRRGGSASVCPGGSGSSESHPDGVWGLFCVLICGVMEVHILCRSRSKRGRRGAEISCSRPFEG